MSANNNKTSHDSTGVGHAAAERHQDADTNGLAKVLQRLERIERHQDKDAEGMTKFFLRLENKTDTFAVGQLKFLQRLEQKIDTDVARLEQKIDTNTARLEQKINRNTARLEIISDKQTEMERLLCRHFGVTPRGKSFLEAVQDDDDMPHPKKYNYYQK